MINFSGRFRRVARAGATFAAVFCIACGGAQHGPGDRAARTSEDRFWVLAPHPDDELLIAGETLIAAVASHRPLSVVVMTNGDLGCGRDGHARQRETIAALASIGVTEEHVHFLGYPDGYLDSLGPVPLAALARTAIDGTCGVGDHTYASHGEGARDVHSLRTGEPGSYVASGPVDDLVWLLEREPPTEILTTHGIDTHPDHAMTYVYLHRALERGSVRPRVLRSVVHQGPCWPNGAGGEPCPDVTLGEGTPFPPFAPPLDGYAPAIRVASADLGARKREAISHYTTQLGTSIAAQSWLSSFARSDEVFWPESVATGEVTTVSREAPFATESVAIAGAITLALDGSGVSLRAENTVLRQLPVPNGEDPQTPHRWEVAVDREGSFAEINVRRDGELWMLAVVPAHLVSDSIATAEAE